MENLLFINIILSLTLINVWLFRFNKPTSYRGGDAKSMKEEFTVYGLPLWSMYMVGFLKLLISILLIIGLWIPSLNLYSYAILSILMIGALFMHKKVKDPIIKSIPALSILILIIVVATMHPDAFTELYKILYNISNLPHKYQLLEF